MLFVDISSKKTTLVASSESNEISNYDWSPDSRWLSYVFTIPNEVSRIYAYNLETKTSTPITDSWFNSSSPSFSPCGKYLFFSSMRSFNPIYSWTEWNHVYADMVKVYLVTLDKNTTSPFEPKDDTPEVKKR